MSFDFFTQRICPHEVWFETISLDPLDHKTAVFVKPPSNSKIHVYVDNEEIPINGLYSYAELPFSKSGPYNIKAGINDLIYISIGFEAPKFVQLITGKISAIDMARYLQ
ncbi:MAG TPA: hypothetical protein ENI76_06595, partial [Ignavibacteria bacterium]|nr:hypothetical protein [Ignavibacteria bacterium]